MSALDTDTKQVGRSEECLLFTAASQQELRKRSVEVEAAVRLGGYTLFLLADFMLIHSTVEIIDSETISLDRRNEKMYQLCN